MIQRELKFRRELIIRMGGRWLVAIHMENRLNPGVPDLSYVIVDQGHETGWLELKAAANVSPKRKVPIKIEPSQHQWMLKYAHRVPTHILIQVGTKYYLIDGRKHNCLIDSVFEDDLKRNSLHMFEDDALVQELTAVLSDRTRRERNGF